MILQKVRNNLQKLDIRGQGVLVALSGGKDSMCLLHILQQLADEFELRLAACYINHNLRGEESGREEQFIYTIGDRFNIDIEVHEVNPGHWKNLKNKSIEMEARQIRYHIFDKKMEQKKCDVTATAHHLADRIETFFINMSRGGGVETLTSIPFRNKNIIRPMLNVSRREIDNYIALHDIPYFEDSSNGGNDYKRNIVRNKLLPVLREIHPEYEKSFNHVFSYLTEQKRFFRRLGKKMYHRYHLYSEPGIICLNFGAFKKLPVVIKKYVIKFCLKLLGYPVKPGISLLSAACSKRGGITYRKKDFMCVIRAKKIWFINTTRLKGITWGTEVERFPFEYINGYECVNLSLAPLDDPRVVCNFSYPERDKPLIIRGVKDGDRIELKEGRSKPIVKVLKELGIPDLFFDRVSVYEIEGTGIAGFRIFNEYRIDWRFFAKPNDPQTVLINTKILEKRK